MNGKRQRLGLGSCSKLIVGAVVVGWKEVGVKPPDNVWIVEVVIIFITVSMAELSSRTSLRNPGGVDSWR